jgi:hypothetical protein
MYIRMRVPKCFCAWIGSISAPFEQPSRFTSAIERSGKMEEGKGNDGLVESR